MPAFTNGGLMVVFTRDGGQPDERPARDAGEAAAVAIRMLAVRLRFHPGDAILCRRADDAQADGTQADLPEVSRASHHSAQGASDAQA
jgi:hypothetical protein